MFWEGLHENSMDPYGTKLARELREVSEQLELLEVKLTSPGTRGVGGKVLLDGEEVEIDLLSEFKSALDRARHSVWALLEDSGGYSGHSTQEALENYRMQRASELLRALRYQIDAVHRPDTPAARAFFDEVRIIADLALCGELLPKKKR